MRDALFKRYGIYPYFEDKVSDCYNIVKIPNDVCLSGVNKPLPEYVLTAEITDYFMNLCDEYDWKDAEKPICAPDPHR